MIEQFGTLYAGNVELGDVGARATPVNERRYGNEFLVTAYETTERLARLLDDSGYDVLWLAEHHFQPEGYELFPNIPMLAVHLAHLTSRIRFGSAFNIAPMWHPLRLAEDLALADVFTGGRLLFGVGRGYHVREVETLGGPLLDQDRNRSLFEEQVEILHRALHEDSFSFHGEHYDIPPALPYRGYTLEEITLTPRPVHRPVELWMPIVSANRRGLDLMFRYGMRGLLSGGLADGAARNMAAYLEAAQEHGHDWQLGHNLRLQVVFHLADTEAAAVREATPWWEENVKMFAPLNFIAGMTPEQVATSSRRGDWTGSGIPTLQDQVDARAVYCGSPEGFVVFLREVGERYPGLREMNVNHAFAAPAARMLEQFAWFAADVMPSVAQTADV